MTRTAKLLLPWVALFLGAAFLTISQFRLIDGDEGFYLLAAKLVFQGKRLYSDFFFTQMPLVPFVYGSWMKLTGNTWTSTRLLSGAFAAALGCLLYWHVARITKSWLAGCLAALLFAFSAPAVVWFTVVKTYSISTLLLFGAYLAVWEGSGKWTLTVSGLLFALTVDSRLYLAGIAPVLLLAIYARRAELANLSAAYARFFAGLALGLVPNLYWLVRDPGNYYFNNLGFHAFRSGEGLIGDYGEKLATLLQVIGLGGLNESGDWSGLPFGLLVLANGISFAVHRRLPGPRVWPAMYIGAAVILVSALPTPSYQQYFCVAVPFLIVGAVTFALDASRYRAGLLALVAVAIAEFSFLAFDLRRYLATGVGVAGVDVRESAINWRVPSVREISRELDRQVVPGEPVMSFWPGYLVESQATSFPGMETHVGLFIADDLTPAQLAQYRILSEAGIDANLKRHNPRVVVLGNQESMGVDGAPFARMLQLHGYRITYRLGHTAIYTCK